MEAVRQRDEFRRDFQRAISGRSRERYIWAEELVNKTLVIYKGRLKQHDDFFDKRIVPVSAILVIVLHGENELFRFVSVNLVANTHRVYIEEQLFNSCWKQIKINVQSGIEYTISVKNGCKIKEAREILDFTHLYTDAKFPCLLNGRIAYRKIGSDEEKKAYQANRQRLLDNKDYKFFFSYDGGFAHDKKCPEIKYIRLDRFSASEEMPEGRSMCPKCRRTSLIRKACEPHSKYISLCDCILTSGKVKNDRLEYYINELGLRFYTARNDELNLQCGEDRWVVGIQKDGCYVLWHNNYIRTGDKERYITNGFHLQNFSSYSLDKVLNYIPTYSWEGHLQAEEAARLAAEAEKTAAFRIKLAVRKLRHLLEKAFSYIIKKK